MSAVGLAGQAEHHVELELLAAVRARELGGAHQVALLGLALDARRASRSRRAVGGGGQRAVAAALEQADDLVVEPIGAQAGDADLAAAVDEWRRISGSPG